MIKKARSKADMIASSSNKNQDLDKQDLEVVNHNTKTVTKIHCRALNENLKKKEIQRKKLRSKNKTQICNMTIRKATSQL